MDLCLWKSTASPTTKEKGRKAKAKASPKARVGGALEAMHFKVVAEDVEKDETTKAKEKANRKEKIKENPSPMERKVDRKVSSLILNNAGCVTSMVIGLVIARTE